MIELEEPDHLCEMCRHAQVRFVHYLWHPEYPGILGVGRVCASRMEDDYAGAKRREREWTVLAGRRAKWLNRAWQISEKGNPCLNTRGVKIVVFRRGDRWNYVLNKRDNRGRPQFGPSVYTTEDEAKLAALDALEFALNT